MSKTFYLPMTRMNFVAAIDAYIVAPAAFFMGRKFYDDLTGKLPFHLTAFLTPTHFLESWSDDDTELNFPILVEVKLSRIAGIKTFNLENENIVLNDFKKSAEIGSDTIFLINHHLTLDHIVKVIVPGERTKLKIMDDPFIRDRSFNLNFQVSLSKPHYSNILQNLKESDCKTYFKSGTDIERLNSVFSLAGGGAAISEAASTGKWFPEHKYTTQVLSCIDSIISERNFTKKKRSHLNEIRNFSHLDMFQKKRKIIQDDIKLLGEISIRNIYKDFSIDIISEIIPESEISENTEEGRLYKADQICMSILLRECIKGTPKNTSPNDILEKTTKRLSEIAAENFDINNECKRVISGLELVTKIVDGVERVDNIFTRKTQWARSIRATTIFFLRPDIKEIIEWPLRERPGNADIEDFLRGAFLCGLYTGFTRLPIEMKEKWGPLIEVPIAQMLSSAKTKRTLPVEETKWRKQNGYLHGETTLIYLNKKSIKLQSIVNITRLLQDMTDKIYPKLKEGNLSYKDKILLGIIANQSKLYNAQLLKLKIERDENLNQTVQRAIEENNKQIELIVPKTKINITTQWDYAKIIDNILDLEFSDIPEEVICLICHHLQYNFQPFEIQSSGGLKDDKNIIILQLVDAFLDDIGKNNNLFGKHKINKIQEEGITLTHELINILQSENILGLKQQRELRSALLYLVLPNDIISEETDPELGMIDDWILLAKTVNTILVENKLKNKNIPLQTADKIKERAEKILRMIEDELGSQFIETIIRKICLVRTE